MTQGSANGKPSNCVFQHRDKQLPTRHATPRHATPRHATPLTDLGKAAGVLRGALLDPIAEVDAAAEEARHNRSVAKPVTKVGRDGSKGREWEGM